MQPSSPRSEAAPAGEAFLRLAEAIDAQRPSAALRALMEEVRRACDAAAAQVGSAELRQWLVDVQTALRTWQEVWPRLSGQPPFRQAVAREARLWARRFA